MLARQLVDPPFQRLAEAEIIGMQGQHFLAPNGVENPVGELDFDPEQAAVEPVFAADRRGIDQAEAVGLLLVARADIRR